MKHVLACLAIALGAICVTAPVAEAQRLRPNQRKKTTKKKPAPKKKASAKKRAAPKKTRRGKQPVTIPIDIGIGPAVHMITGPVQDDQQLHYGIKFSVKAIIDGALIKKNLHRVPKSYRKYARKIKEARVGHMLIPDTFFISPKNQNTGIYGVSWRPIGLDIPLLRVPRLAVGAGINLTYMYVDMDVPVDGASDPDAKENVTTHFLRPGADLQASFEVPFSKSFLVSVGWQSTFYPPQELGGEIFSLGDTDNGIWHIGQAYLKFHFRFPYSLKI